MQNLFRKGLNGGVFLTRASSMQSGKVMVNGVNLFYEKSGSSEHVVICMPGALGSSRSDFTPQIEGLSKSFTVIAVDPRGYGKSIPPQRDFPRDFYHRDADDAAELMLKLGFSKFSVLGWSDGGISAIIMASRQPELIRKMVVWGSNVFVTKEDVEMCEATRDISKWNPKMSQPLIDLYGKDGLQNMWNGWLDAYKAYYTDNEGNICKEELSKVSCPLLVIHGQKDPLVSHIHPELIHNSVPGSKLHLMPEGRHNLHLRYHEVFNEIVTKFLEESNV